MAGLSPTQRTLKVLRAQGFKCAIVEHWNPHARIRQDMFGIIDIVALDHTRGVLGVQCTGSAFAEHHRKLTGERREACQDWLLTPGAYLELWGWRKVKKRRLGAVMVWKPRVRVYTLADFGIDPFEK